MPSNTFSSITAAKTNEPFELQVARGAILGHVAVNADGYNAAVGTSEEGVWGNGGTVNWPASASVMNVTSSNAADDAASTGMRTVRIYGLDSNWDLATEDVTLDGQTIVATTTSFIRVFKAHGLTYGTGLVNAGVIYVFTGTETSGVPDTSTAIFTTILAGENESTQAFYTVPRNHTGYLLDIFGNAFVAADEHTTFRLKARPNANSANAGFRVIEKHTVLSQLYTLYALPIYFDAYTDIMLTATAQATSTITSGAFNMVLIQDNR